jgi:hypothetical protein
MGKGKKLGKKTEKKPPNFPIDAKMSPEEEAAAALLQQEAQQAALLQQQQQAALLQQQQQAALLQQQQQAALLQQQQEAQQAARIQKEEADKIVNIIVVANYMKAQISIFYEIFQQYSSSISQMKGEAEVEAYYSCEYNGMNHTSQIIQIQYPSEQKQFIVNSILFFRFLCMIANESINVPSINADTLDVIKRTIAIIKSYQADTDRRDILEAEYDHRLPLYYQLGRYYSLDPAFPDLFTRDLKDTGLGAEMKNLAHPDDEDDEVIVIGEERLHNILFETLAHLVLITLVFPFWPNPIPPFRSPISVYIGTGRPDTDANCINFKILQIISGQIRPGDSIQLYAPITSASNDLSVAIIKFVKSGGIIIKINLASGKTFMCVSTSPNEAETFVLAGTYQFIQSYQINFQDKPYTVYEYNQINDGFNGISEDYVQKNWKNYRDKLSIKSYEYAHTIEESVEPGLANRMSSLKKSNTLRALRDPNAGGSNPNRKTKKTHHKSKRRTNKKRKTNKKRRTNKKRTNKRRRI